MNQPKGPPRQASRASSSSRSGCLGYLFQEQRLIFIAIGALLASTFFLLRSYNVSHFEYSPYPEDSQIPWPRREQKPPTGLRLPLRRIVVTGGAGFVGSHLVDKLIARGDHVIVIDNFFTGRRENLAHHLGNPRFELIRHDVVEPIMLEVDQIYHLACPASPVHYKYNPIKTIISFLYFNFLPP